MKLIYPLLAILLLALVAYFGAAAGLEYLFGVIIPYISIVLFLGGFSWKIYDWVKSPVPFRIPTTCGQAKSLEWIKRDELESPSGLFLPPAGKRSHWNGLSVMNWKVLQDFGEYSAECHWKFCFSAHCSVTQKQNLLPVPASLMRPVSGSGWQVFYSTGLCW